MPKRRLKRSSHAQINALFGVTSHRWPGLPSAKEMGVTSTQRAAIIRIRRLYGEVADQLGYLTARAMKGKIAEAEDLMRRHFPGELERIRAARAPVPFPAQQEVATEERALAG